MSRKPLDKILTFTPNYKHVIWGGNRISKLKGEAPSGDNLGESWEISAIEGHESIVESGEFAGTKLTDLALQYEAELLGDKVAERYDNTFPLLIKFIDARQILSVQVHPNDEIARRRHNSRGKSEMWYVIDAEDNAQIYCGLKAPLSPDDYVARIADKSIMDVVASYKSEQGQFYYIPSGTIHSIGAGNLIAEIQESSDITYRVYDHNRLDKNGKERELHTEAARDAIDYNYPHSVYPTAEKFEISTANAVKCEHFIVGYHKIDNETIKLQNSRESFTVIIVVNGQLIIHADGEKRTLTAGHTALIPACVDQLNIEGSGIILTAHI